MPDLDLPAASVSTHVDLAARLRETAERRPGHAALRWQGRSTTYAELDAKVDRAAGALQDLGVVAGDRVALVLGNTPAFVEAYLGVLRCGATAVPVNSGTTRDELAHLLAHSRAGVAVVAATIVDVVLAEQADAPALRHVLVAGTATPPEGTLAWSALLADAPAPTPVPRDRDDLAALVYTSGTTGRPKGAMLSRGNLVANVDQSLAGRFRLEEDDVVLLVLPLFHIYALNVGLGAAVRVGATVVLVERFDPVATRDVVDDERVTILLGAPTMFVAWLQADPDTDAGAFATIRLAASGAAALPRRVLESFRERFGVTIWEGYGLTEASPSVTSNAMTDEARPGSVGKPLPDLELRLVDAAGDDVAPGDPGEVLVRGPNVFHGYLDDPEATAEVLDADGWLHTGDVGSFDADGYLYLVDRLRDLIIVSGFNVFPREVERVLQLHPAVAECAVIGRPHPYTGESVHAAVVLATGSEATTEELLDHCRVHLSRYKCPQAIRFVDELPHTSTGKVRRSELRAQADADRTV